MQGDVHLWKGEWRGWLASAAGLEGWRGLHSVRERRFSQPVQRKLDGGPVLILRTTKGFTRLSLTNFFPTLLEAKIRMK